VRDSAPACRTRCEGHGPVSAAAGWSFGRASSPRGSGCLRTSGATGQGSPARHAHGSGPGSVPRRGRGNPTRRCAVPRRLGSEAARRVLCACRGAGAYLRSMAGVSGRSAARPRPVQPPAHLWNAAFRNDRLRVLAGYRQPRSADRTATRPWTLGRRGRVWFHGCLRQCCPAGRGGQHAGKVRARASRGRRSRRAGGCAEAPTSVARPGRLPRSGSSALQDS